MILPEDTKEPLYSDDEDDFYLPQPFPNSHAAQHTAFFSTYASSPPYSSASHPLLEAQEDDIELGPAPPYSADYDPPTIVSFRRTRDQKRRGPWAAFRRAAFWVGMGIMATMMLVFWTGVIGGPRRAWRGRRPHRWGEGPVFDHDDQDGDGAPVTCANFTAAGWTQLPANLPHPPSGRVEEGGSRWSVNQTFLLPTNAPGELFTHLTGYAGIGNYLVDTYDPADDELYKRDLKGIFDTAPFKGEYVRVKVEPVVTLRPDEEIQGSDGLRLLQAAKVCLMDRSKARQVEARDGPPGPPPKPGRGVGLYTRAVDDLPSHDHNGNPLQFRIHVAVPTTVMDSPSFAQGMIDALSGGHARRHPKGLVKELELSGEVGGIFVSNLTTAAIGDLDLKLQVGEIVVDDLRVDAVRFKTNTGEIKGKVAVMRSVDADTPTGEIDLDLAIASPPPYSLPPLPPAARNSSADGSRDVCALPPVYVNARTASGTVKLNYTGWEDECRTLSQQVQSFVGTIEVHAHALYQGPYQITSDLGQVKVDIPPTTEDPTGQGRVRDISLEKQGRLGSQVWRGEARWREPDVQAQDIVSAVAEDDFGVGTQRRRDQPRMDIKTSVGSVHLVF